MAYNKLIITAFILNSLVGCTQLEHSLIGITDKKLNLSEPYESPHILVGVGKSEITIPHSNAADAVVKHLSTPATMSINLSVSKTQADVYMALISRYKDLRPSVPINVDFNFESKDNLRVTHYYANAILKGCESQYRNTELRDGKTGFSAGLECSTLQNLVMSVSDPRDLIGQSVLNRDSAVQSTSAIQKYNKGSVMPLQEANLGAGG